MDYKKELEQTMRNKDTAELKKVRVGLVIPTYNSAKTIVETVNSLKKCLSLTRLNCVYIADDCSVDDTLTLAAENLDNLIPVHILNRPKNVGERANVNHVFEIAKKNLDWILILHSDDLAKLTWLVEMFERIESCSDDTASICSSWDSLSTKGNLENGENEMGVRLIKASCESARSTLIRGGWWHISGCAIRTGAFEEIGGFEPNMPQLGDLDWVIRCFLKGWHIEFLPRSLITYRLHDQSVSAASFRYDRDITEYLEMLNKYRGLISIYDKTLLHAKFFFRCLRRAGRSLLNGQFEFFLRRVNLSMQIIKHFLCVRATTSLESMKFINEQS